MDRARVAEILRADVDGYDSAATPKRYTRPHAGDMKNLIPVTAGPPCRLARIRSSNSVGRFIDDCALVELALL